MTKKRCLKTKNFDCQDTSLEGERILSISQSVIIKNICEESLLEPSAKVTLPDELLNIYQSMMGDLSFINGTQISKDCSYYNCNISFWKGEETICLKRKAILEFMINEKNIQINEDQNRKKDKVHCKPMMESEIKLKLETEDNRSIRKRKSTSKIFKDYLEDLVEVDKEENDDIYNPEEVKVVPKKSNHQRHSSINVNRLREHSLLEKIVLGINCVRHWIEKGLYLTKVTENDLGLLLKRMSGTKCSLSNLSEHTDENNNRFLSVIIQPPDVEEARGLPINTDSNMAPSRQKLSKQHVSAIYRPRHNIPNILSRPTLSNEERRLSQRNESMPTFSAVKTEDNPESIAKTVATVIDYQPSDPCMSASRLLRLKLERSVNVNPTKPSSNHDLLPSYGNPKTAIFYQQLPRTSHFSLPLFLSPRTNLVPIVQRPLCMPLFQYAPSPTKPNQSTPILPPRPSSTFTIHGLGSDQTSHSSIVLKNLLQQSTQSQQNIVFNKPINNGSSGHMVPFSVFRTNNGC